MSPTFVKIGRDKRINKSINKVDEEEKMNYPVPGKDDEYYEERLDVDNAVEFGRYEFLKACQTMGIVKDGINTNGVS